MDPDLNVVLERVASGEALSDIAADYVMSPVTLRARLRATPELSARYDEAQIDRAHLLADQILSLADNPSRFEPAQLKLQIDTRKWMCSKLYPRLYGDRVQTELSGAIGVRHEDAVRALLADTGE